MPLAKHNSTTERATGLIFLTSFQDVPFYQPQCIQYVYHGLTVVLLCVVVLFADNARCQFAMVQYGFPLVFSCYSAFSGFIAEKFLPLLFVYNAM